jgi:hypothetical protein
MIQQLRLNSALHFIELCYVGKLAWAGLLAKELAGHEAPA